MSKFKQANQLFSAGDFHGAIDLYQQAIEEHPELASVFQLNLERARSRLGITSNTPRAILATPPEKDSAQSPILLKELFREVEEAANKMPNYSTTDKVPLVSIIMTAHNVEQYIEDAVTSLLRQTYKNFEVWVIDDASTDRTPRILQRLAKTDRRLKYKRLNANLGTYFAKNYGVTLCAGEYVFFQDGDDICHPERIRLSMQGFVNTNVVCVRSCYSRVLFPEGRVIPVNGLVKKLGLITLGVRRSVFDDIGFFNSTSKASDDEFFRRVKTYYKEKGGQVKDVSLPLYYNTLRDGSLFGDMIANDPRIDGEIEQKPSPSRTHYVEQFSKIHKDIDKNKYREFFKFPVIRDLITVMPDMTRLANPELPVVVSLCSIPERTKILKIALESLAPQVDEINVYLDRYTEIPDFVKKCHKNVNVVLSKDVPGLRDNGKFLPFNSIEKECYYFTADDDILYPPDYISAMVRKIDYYKRMAVVGVHGVLIPDRPSGYFSGFRRVYHFKQELGQDALVSNLGTGTVGFYSGSLKGLNYQEFAFPGMVDLFLSVFCKQNDIPMVAISRPDNWLSELQSASSSLFEEFRGSDEKQRDLVQSYLPWGYTAINRAVYSVSKRMNSEESQRLTSMVPDLNQCFW